MADISSGQTLGAGVDAGTVDSAPLEAVQSHGMSSIDEIAEAFGQDAEDAEGAEAEAPAEQPAEAPQEAPEEPGMPMPEGWEEAQWQALGPELRKAVNAREQAHAQALVEERRQSAEARQNRDAYLGRANQILESAKRLVGQIMEGEFAGIAGAQLAQPDPPPYRVLRQQYDARQQAVQAIQQEIARTEQAYRQDRQRESWGAMQSELSMAEPKLRAMFGAGWNGKQFAADAAAYLQEQGFSRQAINGITRGCELELVAKAMAWDRAAGARANAQKKLAEAPAVEAPRGTAQRDEAGAAYKRAKSILHKNPRSTEALADVFSAM
ncbi:MAG: hypothetical protein K6E40_06665 [Desulfovibrio sp.]|nr:hypothetical protein [Desulfovibrio sp.]